MRASCGLMGVNARVVISALLAPKAWMHATTVELVWYMIIFAFLPSGVNLPLIIGRHKCNAFWVEQPVRLAYWVYCVDRFTHSSVATVPDF